MQRLSHLSPKMISTIHALKSVLDNHAHFMYNKKSNSNTYPCVKMTFSVNPVRHVATASMKVRIPKVAWMGTREARNPAVAFSQQSRMRKLKKPTTN